MKGFFLVCYSTPFLTLSIKKTTWSHSTASGYLVFHIWNSSLNAMLLYISHNLSSPASWWPAHNDQASFAVPFISFMKLRLTVSFFCCCYFAVAILYRHYSQAHTEQRKRNSWPSSQRYVLPPKIATEKTKIKFWSLLRLPVKKNV